MITILAVADPSRAEALDEVAARNPSVELLHAADLEEALDRLARNRRIDAVLLLVGPEAARAITETLLEEDPGAPPIFVSHPGESAESILESIARKLAP